jgi:hypothetical protein
MFFFCVLDSAQWNIPLFTTSKAFKKVLKKYRGIRIMLQNRGQRSKGSWVQVEEISNFEQKPLNPRTPAYRQAGSNP